MDTNELKIVVNSGKIWQTLDKWLETCYNNKEWEVDNATDLPIIYRAQGYRRALADLRKLKDRVNAEQK